MIFSGYYLFSDIDGTLGLHDKGIPQRNVSAISRFVENGGSFSLCTGRMAENIKNFTKDILVNGSCITDNGAAFYDYPTGKSYNIRTLPNRIGDYLKVIIRTEELLEVSAITRSGLFRIMNADNFYIPNGEDVNQRLFKLSKVHTQQLRVVFHLPYGVDAREKVSLWNSWDFPGVDFIQSSGSYIEMMPKGVNKGSALIKLCETQGISLNRTFFIGDSYNDREIFKTAGFSACVAETPAELQGLCDCILGPCMDGALADFIELIEMKALRIA